MFVLRADSVEQLLDLETICERLGVEGLRPVLLASGRPDHRHLFCVVRDATYLDRLRAEAESQGIGTRSPQRIRPPFARHPLDLRVRLLHPSSPEAALEALTSADWDAYAEPRLSSTTWNLLRWGGPEGKDSETLYSVCLGAAAVGYSVEKLYKLLEHPRNNGGASIHKRVHARGESYAREWFSKHVWGKAQRQVAAHPTFEGREDAVQAVLAVGAEIVTYKWQTVELPATGTRKPTKVGGNSLRKGLTAIIDLCLEWGTVTPWFGQRHLGELSGMERSTVNKVLQGLEHLGWINLVKRGGGMKANTYRLLIGTPRHNAPIDTPAIVPVYEWSGEKRVSVGHDLFQRGSGVGDAGRRLLGVMSPVEGGTVKLLAKCAPLNEGYARKVLKNMEALGLVRREGPVWYSIEADLDEVAKVAGTAGRGERRKAKNDERRAVQQRRFDEWKRKQKWNRTMKQLEALR